MGLSSRNVDAPVSVHIIIKRQLFVLLDMSICKDAHPDTLAHLPLGDVTVRAAAVVSETANAASLGRVDVLKP